MGQRTQIILKVVDHDTDTTTHYAYHFQWGYGRTMAFKLIEYLNGQMVNGCEFGGMSIEKGNDLSDYVKNMPNLEYAGYFINLVRGHFDNNNGALFIKIDKHPSRYFFDCTIGFIMGDEDIIDRNSQEAHNWVSSEYYFKHSGGKSITDKEDWLEYWNAFKKYFDIKEFADLT